MSTYFTEIDWATFWNDSDYFTSPDPLTDKSIRNTEQLLGYKLPASYIELLRTKNGGSSVNDCFPTEASTSWAEDHISISGICGIGGQWGIDSDDLGSRFMIEEWGYPNIGIVFCECPSAGHDAVMLDYSECGPEGEPRVIHVDVEIDDEPTITPLADNFSAFIKGLVNAEVYDNSEERKQQDLEKVSRGAFSSLLAELCSNTQAEQPELERKIRRICTQIVEDKGYFALHGDPLSYLMYDIQFWLYVHTYPNTKKDQYVDNYQQMIAFAKEFGTGGYAPSLITDWFKQRRKEQRIEIKGDGSVCFTPVYKQELMNQLSSY